MAESAMTLTEFLGYGTEIAEWLFGILGLGLNFILSHWLLIIGIILSIVVMAVMLIRRFY